MSSKGSALSSAYDRTLTQRRRMPRRILRSWLATLLPLVRIGLLIAVLSVVLLPIVYLLALSLKTPDQVLEGIFLPTKPTLRNWTTIFQNVPLALYLSNSVIAAISGGLLTLVITIPAVYALCRIRIGHNILPGIVLGSYIAPPMVPLIPLFFWPSGPT